MQRLLARVLPFFRPAQTTSVSSVLGAEAHDADRPRRNLGDLASASVLSNSVKGSSPWYTRDLEEQMAIVETAPERIRQYLRQFAHNGYAIIEEAVSEEACNRALIAFEALVERNAMLFAHYRDESGCLSRLVNLHVAIPEFRDIFMHNKAVAVLNFLFNAKPCIYTSLYFQRGSQQDIHRDTPYFSTEPRYYYVGCWTALEKADEENGALQVIPGGHLRPELDLRRLASTKYADLNTINPNDPDLWDIYQKGVREDCLSHGLQVKTLSVPKGATVLWHPQLPHGGSHIKHPTRTRNSLVIHSTPTGTPVYQQNAFFNPDVPFSESPGWAYWQYPQADLLFQDRIDIMHQKQVLIRDLA